MKFNINDNIKVKLTNAGVEELKRQHDELKLSFPKIGDFNAPKTDKDGYSTWQMHCIMQQLGHMLDIGGNLPFEANIIIVEQ